MKKINPNSPKIIAIIGLGLLTTAIIFSSNSLISTFCVLSGFIFLITSLVKIIINKFFKSKKIKKPFKFWFIMSIFLPLLFLILYIGSKNPLSTKEKISENNSTTPTVVIEGDKQLETTALKVTTTPQPTSKPTQPTTTPEDNKTTSSTTQVPNVTCEQAINIVLNYELQDYADQNLKGKTVFSLNLKKYIKLEKLKDYFFAYGESNTPGGYSWEAIKFSDSECQVKIILYDKETEEKVNPIWDINGTEMTCENSGAFNLTSELGFK